MCSRAVGTWGPAVRLETAGPPEPERRKTAHAPQPRRGPVTPVATLYARSLGDFLALVTTTALGAGRVLLRLPARTDRP